MSARRIPASRGRGVVVLAGESANDRRMLAAFIKGAHPDLVKAAVLTEITDPVRLRKKTGDQLASAAGALVNKARGKARLKKGELVGVVVHEDMDASLGPAYDRVRSSVSAALKKAAAGSSSVYALAAAESEAWLLLFPDAFQLYRRSWAIPAAWRGKDSGRRQTPKEDIEKLLPSPRFRESDGPEIASTALENGLLAQPCGSNRSYQDFVAEIGRWPVP